MLCNNYQKQKEREKIHTKQITLIFLLIPKGYIYIEYKLLTSANLDPEKVDLWLGHGTETNIHMGNNYIYNNTSKYSLTSCDTHWTHDMEALLPTLSLNAYMENIENTLQK